MKVSKNNKKI